MKDSSNTKVSLLKDLCVLTRSAKNHIEPITAAEAYSMLLQQVYRPADPADLTKTLELIDRLAARIKLYRLGCNVQPEAAELSYRVMSE